MLIISYSPRWQRPQKAVIAGFAHAGTLANADKKGFVTVVSSMISSIINAGKRHRRKKGFVTALCLIISYTFTLAKTHP